MSTEVPIPTVVEVYHKGKSRNTVRWKVCWSDGSRSTLDHTSLEIACEWAAYEYLGRLWWAENSYMLCGSTRVLPASPT
jgi:hypothetical protein